MTPETGEPDGRSDHSRDDLRGACRARRCRSPLGRRQPRFLRRRPRPLTGRSRREPRRPSMHFYYALLAFDLANERAAEADAQRRARLGRSSEPRTSAIRRAIARLALAVARAADAETVRSPLATN